MNESIMDFTDALKKKKKRKNGRVNQTKNSENKRDHCEWLHFLMD